MNSLVVLTRGYNDKSKYQTLIDRNIKLEKYYKENIDYIIFHEVNHYFIFIIQMIICYVKILNIIMVFIKKKLIKYLLISYY